MAVLSRAVPVALQVYQIYAKRPPEEVHTLLRALGADYVILEDSICYERRHPRGCRLRDLLDVANGHVSTRLPEALAPTWLPQSMLGVEGVVTASRRTGSQGQERGRLGPQVHVKQHPCLSWLPAGGSAQNCSLRFCR